MITPELQKYYQDRFDMFSSTGWKDLVEDLKNMKQTTSDISNCGDEKAFWIAKGELRLLNWFLSLEELSEEGYKQQTEIEDASL
jgi:hypothetical protein